MRALIPVLTAALALSLAACGNNDQTDNNQNVDENLTAENIVSNDVTAIDGRACVARTSALKVLTKPRSCDARTVVVSACPGCAPGAVR